MKQAEFVSEVKGAGFDVARISKTGVGLLPENIQAIVNAYFDTAENSNSAYLLLRDGNPIIAGDVTIIRTAIAMARFFSDSGAPSTPQSSNTSRSTDGKAGTSN